MWIKFTKAGMSCYEGYSAKTQAIYKSPENSPKPQIRFLYSLSNDDNRTTTGQNTSMIQQSCVGIPSRANIKRTVKYVSTPNKET